MVPLDTHTHTPAHTHVRVELTLLKSCHTCICINAPFILHRKRHAVQPVRLSELVACRRMCQGVPGFLKILEFKSCQFEASKVLENPGM